MTARLALIGLLAGACAARAAAPAVAALGDLRDGLTAPARVATSAGGLLYVAEPAAGTVTIFDAFGRRSALRGGFSGPVSVAVDAQGRVLVGESGPGAVRAYDADWQVLYSLGAGDGEFASPGFIAPDPSAGSGLVFVSDGPANRIAAYSNGVFAFAFGTAGHGNGQFDFPAGLCATSNELFVVDQAADRLQVFDHAGTFLRAFSLVLTNASGQLGGRAQGLCADAAGRMYAADSFEGVVKCYGPTGDLLAVIGGLGDGPAQLRSPCDVAVDPCGRLFVAAPNNGRVERFGLDDYLHLAATPADATLAAGSNVTLSVTCGGTGPYTFQWRRDDVDVPGATNAALVLAGLATNDRGRYAVAVTGPSGTVLCGSATLAVLQPPAITLQPLAGIIARGGTTSLTIAASGDALAYQWFRNGAARPGATNAVLVLADAQPADAGEYRAEARNAVGAALSAPAPLGVVTPPAILLDPTDVKVIQGNAAVFGVAAEGDALAFAWRYEGGPTPSPDEPTLELANVQPAAGGHYAVIVSNLAGVVTSAPALLSVFVPPAVQEVGAVEPQADGSLAVRIAGDAGYTFSLDASPDLAEWTRLTYLAGATGVVDFVDLDATNVPSRYYRLRWRP